MQSVAWPAPIILVKVWDGDRQFVPVREQLPVCFCSFNNQFTFHFSQGTHHMEESVPLVCWYQLNQSDYES